MSRAPTAIEISEVHKSFRVPTHRVETLKERAMHPFRGIEFMEFKALQDVSFEIAAGSFVGIAGRNGSGKTTLLKLLASIYRPDRGTIRIAGRVAPFIELGVGFNPDLAARDNILLNGVMMGLTAREARERCERVIEFAELEEFTELKLKNYSSGMRVRLGFAMLVEADADILLIDEVLAVGDAAFQQKCTDSFYRFKDEGRTIVLVTHAMEKLKEYCDSAVLLHEGKLDLIGDPEEVGDRYMELNFKRSSTQEIESTEADAPAEALEGGAKFIGFWFENESGGHVDSYKHGDPIRFCAEIEATERIDSLCFGVLVTNPSDIAVLHLRSQVISPSDRPLDPGMRAVVRGEVENPLASGRYVAHIGLTQHVDLDDAIDERPNAGKFLVFGSPAPGGYSGLVAPRHELRLELKRVTERLPA